ncbi:MAG: nucleoside diphosphate kinase regulator [Alphaproteobacteria bacterium]
MNQTLPPITLTRPDHDKLAALAVAYQDHAPMVAEYLEREVGRAKVVAPDRIGPDVVTMGATVHFRDQATGQARTVTLVYPGGEDIAAGRISVITPIGAALVGLAEGQSIVWRTRTGEARELTVLSVERAPAETAA